MEASNRRRLTSWKEIAVYLGRDARTVIRWEKDRGLPIHRLPGGKGRSLFAYTHELDEWAIGAMPPPDDLRPGVTPGPPPGIAATANFPRTLVAAALVIALTLLVGRPLVSGVLWPPAAAERLDLRGNVLTGVTSAGREVWRFDFGGVVGLVNPHRALRLEDIDGDGRRETLASVSLRREEYVAVGTLLALDPSGHVSWTRSVPDRLTIGGRTFGPPWDPADLLTFTVDGHTHIAWAVHHFTWWPAIVAVYDARGARLGSFVNAGWIYGLSVTRDGRYLLASGVSNSRDGAILAVLDARRPSGSSPEDVGSPFACAECPPGSPLRYFLVPWSDVAAASLAQSQPLPTRTQVFPSGAVTLHAIQLNDSGEVPPEVLVEFSPSMEVLHTGVDDTYWRWHERFERQGRLTHDRAHCPFRDGPAVREWTAAHGWREIAAR